MRVRFGSEAAILSRATMRLMRADVTITPATQAN